MATIDRLAGYFRAYQADLQGFTPVRYDPGLIRAKLLAALRIIAPDDYATGTVSLLDDAVLVSDDTAQGDKDRSSLSSLPRYDLDFSLTSTKPNADIFDALSDMLQGRTSYFLPRISVVDGVYLNRSPFVLKGFAADSATIGLTLTGGMSSAAIEVAFPGDTHVTGFSSDSSYQLASWHTRASTARVEVGTFEIPGTSRSSGVLNFQSIIMNRAFFTNHRENISDWIWSDAVGVTYDIEWVSVKTGNVDTQTTTMEDVSTGTLTIPYDYRATDNVLVVKIYANPAVTTELQGGGVCLTLLDGIAHSNKSAVSHFGNNGPMFMKPDIAYLGRIMTAGALVMSEEKMFHFSTLRGMCGGTQNLTDHPCQLFMCNPHNFTHLPADLADGDSVARVFRKHIEVWKICAMLGLLVDPDDPRVLTNRAVANAANRFDDF